MRRRTSKCAPSQSASALAAADENAAASRSIGSGTGDQPVSDRELDALFAPLAHFKVLILAVSGGADSMALMLLAHRWLAARSDAPETIVATVDHGLRAQARAEAEWVATEATALGFDPALLTWSGEKPTTGIQDAARDARYRLLTEFASAAGKGPIAIVTAHTEDDQAETLLMRLSRGSGLDGLSAMAPLRTLDDGPVEVVLARPLLAIPGARLRATLRAAGRPWLEDPSNDAERFERVRIRKARQTLAALGLSNAKMALSARRLARAKEALEAGVDALQRDAHLDLHKGAFASFAAAPWHAAPDELKLRLLARLLRAFGGQEQPLRMAQLEQLLARMSEPDFEGATLAGAAIANRRHQIHVQREAGRSPLPTMQLGPGMVAIWDRRFRVAIAREGAEPVSVRALGGEAYAKLRRKLNEKTVQLPASAAATLPAFWRGTELMCVPLFAELPEAKALWRGSAELYSAEFLG